MQFKPAICYKMAHVTHTEREERGFVSFYEAKARVWRFYASHLYDMCYVSQSSQPKISVEAVVKRCEKKTVNCESEFYVTAKNSNVGSQLMLWKMTVPSMKMLQWDSLKSCTQSAEPRYKPKAYSVFCLARPTTLVGMKVLPQNRDIVVLQSTQKEIELFNCSKMRESNADLSCRRIPDCSLIGLPSAGRGLMSFNRLRPCQLLASDVDGNICIWTIRNREEARSVVTAETTILASQTMGVRDLSWHPLHISLFATVGDSRKLCIWDMRSLGEHKPALVEEVHDATATCIAFNRFNEVLINTASEDKTIKVWDLRCMKKPFYAIRTLTGEINKMKYSNYMESVFATSSNESVFIWDLSQIKLTDDSSPVEHEPLFVHGGHMGKVTDFSWLFCDRHYPLSMCSISEDGPIHMWQLNSYAFLPARKVDRTDAVQQFKPVKEVQSSSAASGVKRSKAAKLQRNAAASK
ncbi:Histone-binding protein RBBP4 [Trichinella spiralis]|uniref:Histone-binding protein RBBP4 n=1 Tax=Trichinella spiralis TaxID=6334 RepID=A0A0V1B546_TRISP|nr:Histone-binding protein RBBP4 [Trichinella spiralis]